MSDLNSQLESLARVPVLLVACDYDGTLAPIVESPEDAEPIRESMVALRNLAGMPGTHVAVISGRALRDLASLTGQPQDVHLVGSHGSEFDLDFASELPSEAANLRDRVRSELAEVAGGSNGFRIEEKPASIAFHYRNADETEAREAVSRIMEGPAGYEGVFTRRGKKVIELGVVTTNKGEALETIRHRVGASAALFIGDDLTDEDAFSTLKGPDVGVKVGDGDTAAAFRVSNPTEVARILARVCELREQWLAGSSVVPINEHAMLSDQRTSALITPDARLVWFCYPRFDAPAMFAELVGGPTAGYFAVRDSDGADPTGQAYVDDTLIVRTDWPTFTVTDYLDCSQGRAYQRAGRSDFIRVIEGTGRVSIEFAPRPDFGRLPTRLHIRDGGIEVEDTHEPIVLRSGDIEWSIVEEGQHQKAVAEIDLHEGEPVELELRCGTARLRPAVTSEADRREQTSGYWQRWTDMLTVPDVAPDLVRRSAITIRGMCYGPTGAILAAPTTSLPEHIGGVRNWDYRYCWLRDGAMAASSLVQLGSTQEAMQFLDWVLNVLDDCPSPERLHPVYTVTADPLGSEAEIAELNGYRGSRPVRISNAASHQVQLDVFGPIVDLIAQLAERGAPLSSQHWRVVEAMVSAVRHRWHEPDHGIWEIRLARRHHVHSKIMCWLTVHRGLSVAQQTFDREPDGWAELRDEIAADVLANGWSDKAGAFTAAYGGTDLDAAALEIGLRGLIDPGDSRFVRTVEAIEKHLRHGPSVYRYRYDDGLPGGEGAFHLCTAWLIEAYLLIGRVDDARTLFDDMIELTGRTGLLSEQYNSHTGDALGNHPQAFSHLGVIDTAVALSEINQ